MLFRSVSQSRYSSVSEAFKAQKQAEDLAIKKARLALDRDKFDFSKTVKETTPTYAFEYVPVCQIEYRRKSSEVLIDSGVSEPFYSQV